MAIDISLHEEPLLQPQDLPVTVEDMTGLYLKGHAEAEVLLDVGFEVPSFIVRHRDHHLEQAARPSEGQQLADLGLREAAELDVAEPAHGLITGLAPPVCSCGEWEMK